MVEIVMGSGLGLERTSGWLLGSRGSLGDASFARYGENVFVNAANGNLVIERRDDMLFGNGPDSEVDSIYNSQSDTSDDNGDRWRTSAARQVILSGTVNTAGSTVQRFAADGSDELYTWDAGNSRYVCTQMGDANDTITFNAGIWTWKDGTTQNTETYSNAVSGYIIKATDPDGRALTFDYITDSTGKYLVSKVTTDNGETTEWLYGGTNGNQLQKLKTTLSDGTIVKRVSYAYDSSNRLSTVTLDRTETVSTDSSSVKLTYGYAGMTSRVTSITGDDGSSLVIGYQQIDGVNRVVSLTQTLASGATALTSFSYDTVHRKTTITDPLLQSVTMTYDTSGRLIQLDMPSAFGTGPALTSTFTYKSATDNHVTSVQDASGNVTTYDYDGRGNLTTIEDAAGDTIKRTYDPVTNALLTERRYVTADDGVNGAANPETTRYVYDEENHLSYEISALGEVTQYLYFAGGNRKSSIVYRNQHYDVSGLGAMQALDKATMDNWVGGITDRSANERVDMTYDARGNLVTTTAYGACLLSGAGDTATSTLTTYAYDQAGQLRSRQVDGMSAELFAYDGLFRMNSSTDRNGNVMTVSFQDTACQQVVTFSASGVVETSTYDLAGRLISVARSGTGVAAATVAYKYDADNQLRMVTDAFGNRSYFVYDADGRKVADIAADGAVTEYGYDKSGRLTYTLGYATRLNLDSQSQVLDNNGKRLFDTSGNPTAVILSSIQPGTNAADLWSWRVYDKADRLVETVDGNGAVVQYVYDGESRLTSTIAYYNRLTSVQISGFKSSRAASYTAPTPAAGGTNGPWDSVARNFYDQDGRLIGVLDARGYLIQTIYNEAGETIEVIAYANLTDGSATFSSLLASVGTSGRDEHTRYFYNGEGQLRFAVDASLRLTGYVYNSLGEVLHVTQYNKILIAPSSPSPWTLKFVSDQIGNGPNGRDLENDADNRVTYSIYDNAGQEVYRVNAAAEITQYTYDGMGRVIRTVQFSYRYVQAPPIGDKSKAAWDNWAGVHSTDSFPDNRTTRAYYDPSGRLAYTIDGENYVTQYIYDKKDQKTGEIRYASSFPADDSTTYATLSTPFPGPPGTVPATARQWAYSYDPNGRLTDSFDGLNVSTHYVYDAQGRLTDKTVAANVVADAATTHYTYDLAGRVASQTAAYGTSYATATSYTYDGKGNVLSATIGKTSTEPGITTTYTYDQMGLVLETTTPASGTTRADYDAFGNRIRFQDALGNVSVACFDQLDRVIYQTDAEMHVTWTTYGFGNEISLVTHYHNQASSADPAGVPSVQPNAADAVTKFDRDRLGRLVQVTDAENASEIYKLNAFGDRIEVTNKLGGKTINLFDHRGLLKQETLPITAADASGNQIAVVNTFGYDARGNLNSKVEAVGLLEVRTTSYKYDLADRLTDTIHEDLVPIIGSDLKARPSVKPAEHLDYDSRGNLIASADALGNRTMYFYDDLDRKIAQVDPTLALSTWTYYGTGNVQTANVYGDRLTSAPTGHAAPVPVDATNYRQTSYAYDGSGRLLSATVKDILTGVLVNGVYTTTSGNVTASTDNDLITSNSYDAAGNLTSQTDAQGGVSYFYYDKAGRKIGEVDAGRYLTAYDLDADGNITKETRYAMAIPSTATVDTTSTMLYLKGKINANAADRVTDFEYDRNGRRTAEVREGVDYWTLDANHKPVLTTGNARIEYDYNGLGEVTSRKEATTDTTIYDYDALGRQTSVTGPSTSYWKASNGTWVTGARKTVNAYDGLNNLISTTVQNTNAAAGDVARTTYFSYGPGGRLASTTDAANFTRSYSYDAAGRVLMESWTRYKSNTTTAVTEANVYRYDAAGRVTMQGMAFKNADGSWTFGDQTRMQYDAYGEVVARGLSADPTGADPTSAYAWQEQYDYDHAGRVWRSRDEGSTKFYVYDKVGNRTLEISSAGTDLWGKSIDEALTAAKGNGSSVGAGYVAGVNSVITAYDARNQATSTQTWRELDATTRTKATTSRTYNAFGEVTRDTDALTRFTDYSYNTLGKLIQTQGPTTGWTDEQGTQHSGRAVQKVYYDISGRLIGTWVATGNRDAQGNYDTLGNTNTRTLLAGTGYDGDEAVVLNEYHADGGVFQNGYDVFGDRRMTVDEISKTENYAYDAMDRLIEQDHQLRTDGSPQLKDYYGYDGLGRRTRHWNSLYMAGGQPTQLETTDYDLQGRVSSMVDLGGNATGYSYQWDGNVFTSGLGIYGGWVKTTTNAAGRKESETQDYFGHVIAHTDFGGIGNLDGRVYSYTYDKAARLTQVLNTLLTGDGYATGTRGEVDYGYFSTGLISSVTGGTRASGANAITATAVTSYAYDLLGERTLETYKVGGVIKENATVQWDEAGRMKSYTDSGVTDGTHPVTIAWEYDRAGNVRHMTSTYYNLDDQGNVLTASPAAHQDFWYNYDAMNRFTTTRGVLSGHNGSTLVTGDAARGLADAKIARWDGVNPGTYDVVTHVMTVSNGVDVTYDKAGNRLSETREKMRIYYPSLGGYIQYDHEERTDFAYTEDGYLKTAGLAVGAEVVHGQSATPVAGSAVKRAEYQRDAMGRVKDYYEYQTDGATEEYHRHDDYDAKSQVTQEVVTSYIWNGSATDKYVSTTTNDYNAKSGTTWTGAYQGGVVTHSSTLTTVNGGTAKTSDTVNTYVWWEGAEQSKIDLTPDMAQPGTVNHTTYTYDALGHLGSVGIVDGRQRTVSFVTAADGTILQRDEADTLSTGDPRQLYFYFDGVRVGDLSNDGTSETDYAQSLALHMSAPSTGPFRYGVIPYADFDQSFDPINGLTYDAAASRYTVQSGDTLASIAQSQWGDASLWYLIADANGLDGSETLISGQDLVIPNKVHNLHNTSDVYRVYDPNEAIGNTSPTVPRPVPGHHHGGCGGFGAILLAAVAIAVVAVLHAPIGNLLESVAGSVFGTGGALGVTGTAVASGALAGAAGSIVSQGVGLLTGIQDKFSWSGVGLAALSGAVGGGFKAGGVFKAIGIGGDVAGSEFLGNVARGAVSDLAQQGVALATGLQAKLDWAGIAAAGIGAGVSGAAARGLAATGAFGHLVDPLDVAAFKGVTGLAGDIASAATLSALNGTDFGDNILRALPSTIASTVGGLVADQLSRWEDTAQSSVPNYLDRSQDGESLLPQVDFGSIGFQYAIASSGDAPTFKFTSTNGSTSLPDPSVYGLSSFSPNDPSNVSTYIVQPGDTLGAIAATRSGLTTSDLAWLNNIPDENRIASGSSLIIPNQSFLDAGRAAKNQFINTAMFLDLVGIDHVPEVVNLATVPMLSPDGLRLIDATPFGSALKTDRFHNIPEYIKALTAYYGTVFHDTDRQGRPFTLYQISGSMPSQSSAATGGYVHGRFEYVIDSRGLLTHQLFVPGGIINGQVTKPR